MEDEKKYKISQLSICSFSFTEIFPTRNGYKYKGNLFCSKRCKAQWIRDFETYRLRS
jgi:hypothetical protein